MQPKYLVQSISSLSLSLALCLCLYMHANCYGWKFWQTSGKCSYKDFVPGARSKPYQRRSNLFCISAYLSNSLGFLNGAKVCFPSLLSQNNTWIEQIDSHIISDLLKCLLAILIGSCDELLSNYFTKRYKLKHFQDIDINYEAVKLINCQTKVNNKREKSTTL